MGMAGEHDERADAKHESFEMDWAAIHREKERPLLERAARRVSARGVDECADVATSDDGVRNSVRLRF